MSESSITMANTDTILAPLDAADLLRHGLLASGSETGTRRIHKRRANRSSDEEYKDVPLDISPNSPAAADAFITIPTVLVSREALLYMGLSDAKATELWNRWTSWPPFGPARETDPDDGGLTVEFIDFVIGHVTSRVQDTAQEDDASWYSCLNACGMAVDVQAAIMDRHFTYLRLSASCLDWVKDTIEMRYAGLKDIQRASREREMELRRQASRPGGQQGGSGGGRRGESSSATQGPSSSSTSSGGGQGRRTASGLQQERTPGISADIWTTATALATRNAPGHTVLFKGVDLARVTGLFDDAGNVVFPEVLRSEAGTDLSGSRRLFYFTPDIDVAQYYARYAKRRSKGEAVAIVCFRIPNAAIERLVAPAIQRIFWPALEWRELVWRGRTGRNLTPQLRKYRDATLVIATISRKPNHAFHQLTSWQDLSEEYVLRVGPGGRLQGTGRLAVQYGISGEEEGIEFLMENGLRGVKVFQYPQPELDAWLTSH